MGKEPSPLDKLVKEADLLRKQVDKIVKESTKNAGNKKLKDKELKLKANFRSCFELKPQVKELLTKAEELSEEKEPGKVKNFETRKKKEIDRITTWMNQLDDAMSKLLPDQEGEEYLKELKKEAGEDVDEEKEADDKKDDEDDDEDEEGDEEEIEEEEEEEEEEEDEEETDVKKVVENLEKTQAEDEDDEEDESEYEDEEEEEEEEEEPETKQKETPIPKARKQAKVEEEDDDDDDDDDEDEDEDDEEEDDEDDEEEEEAEKTIQTTTLQWEALYDYNSQEKGDLSFNKGDILTVLETREDGWWVAENESGDRGNVPSTYLQMYNKYKDVQQDDEDEDENEDEEEEEEEEGEGDGKTPRTPKSGRGTKLWSGIKKAVKETTNKTSVTDVLHALGAVPSGFRASTLAAKFNLESLYLMKNYLAPKLSPSNMSYKDLFFDPSVNKIRTRFVREQRVLTLHNCRQIPLPGAGVEVTGRRLRICLFDGQNILSNIHTIKVASVDKEQRTWHFHTKISDLMDTYQHAEVFIRTNNPSPKLGILIELCFSYIRTSTKHSGEFSCGWVHQPFFDENGLPIQNRSFDCSLNGGTPYEKGVEVDPSISRRTSSNAFMSMLSGNKQPRLSFRLSLPKKEQKDMLDTMPDTLVGNLVLLPLYSYYRQILADNLLRDRLDLESTELIFSPLLATFPSIADQHDLMNYLREAWTSKLRLVKRIELRDVEYMKDLFKKTVMETVYPLYQTATLPPYRSGDTENEEARHEAILTFKKQKMEKRDILAMLLSTEVSFKPMDLKEFSFNVIGPYCLDQNVSEVPAEG